MKCYFQRLTYCEIPCSIGRTVSQFGEVISRTISGYWHYFEQFDIAKCPSFIVLSQLLSLLFSRWISASQCGTLHWDAIVRLRGDYLRQDFLIIAVSARVNAQDSSQNEQIPNSTSSCRVNKHTMCDRFLFKFYGHFRMTFLTPMIQEIWWMEWNTSMNSMQEWLPLKVIIVDIWDSSKVTLSTETPLRKQALNRGIHVFSFTLLIVIWIYHFDIFELNKIRISQIRLSSHMSHNILLILTCDMKFMAR
jgi:hypothetical protein